MVKLDLCLFLEMNLLGIGFLRWSYQGSLSWDDVLLFRTDNQDEFLGDLMVLIEIRLFFEIYNGKDSHFGSRKIHIAVIHHLL